MKIIKTDNFDRDESPDTLIAEGVNPFYGKAIVEFLNKRFSGDRAPDFFKLVDDDHKLKEFNP